MPLRGFSVGDKVRHFDGQVGEVVSISAGSITVRFPAGKRGSWQGVYDRLWFSLYPDGLQKVLDEPRGLSAVEEPCCEDVNPNNPLISEGGKE